MTAEEIRAEAIERLARGQFEHEERIYSTPDFPERAWADVSEATQEAHRVDARVLVDALGDLLPTGEEVSTCFPDEPDADDEAMRRYVTAWQELNA